MLRFFPKCYSDKHFVSIFNPENQHFKWEQKKKSVQNFRTFTNIHGPFTDREIL